jgi:hypothetical protein
MITAIRSINHFIGWEAFLIGMALCIAISILAFILFQPKRNKMSIIYYSFVQFIILEACDIIWTFYLYPNGDYVNRGIVSAYSFLILPFLCSLSFLMFRYVNKRRQGDNQIK